MKQRVMRACLVLATLQLLLLLWVAFMRLRYPFDVEWMEGGQLTHAVRLARGEHIYTRPSADFTAFFYTPLYPALVALLSKLGAAIGPALGRGVSVAATVATLGLLFFVVRREAGSRHALLAVGLYAALDRFAGTFTSVARADALALALAFGAAVTGHYSRSVRGAVIAAVLAVLAVFAKQTMVVTGAVLGGWLLFTDRRRGLWYGAVALVLGISVSLWLERSTGGWFSFYVAKGHQSHGIYWDNLLFFFWRDVLFLAPLLLLAPLAWAWSRFGRHPVVVLAAVHLTVAFVQRALTLDYPPHMYFRELWYESPRFLLLIPPLATVALYLGARDRVERPSFAGGFWLWMLGAAVLASALGHSTPWAYKNAFMPLALFGSLFVALAAKGLGAPALWPVALQLLLLFDAPARRIPNANDHEKAQALRARIARIDGPVLALAHPLLSHEHDGTVHVHQMGLSDVAAIGGIGELEQRAARHAWRAVITDEGDGLDVPAAIRAHYRAAELLDGPWMKTGVRSRPAVLWVPKVAP